MLTTFDDDGAKRDTMDLQAAHRMNGKRWSWTKIAAFVCFACACGLLIGSLAASPTTKAQVDLRRSATIK
jgi:hypothetical protein